MTARCLFVAALLCLGAVAAPAAALQAPGRVAYPAADGRVLHDTHGVGPTVVAATPGGGALLVGGRYFDVELVSLDARGRLRRSFGTNGIARPDLPYGLDVTQVLRRPDGRMVLLGYGRNFFAMPAIPTTLVVGLTASGALDASFGEDGIATTRIYGYQTIGALAPDGSLVLTGAGADPGFDGYGSENLHGEIARLTPRGQPDAAFGTDGTLRAGGVGVAIDATGRTIVALQDGLHALRADGSDDPDFHTTGPLALDAYRETPVIRSSGAIDVVEEHQVVRFTAAGDLDASFGDDGRVALPQGAVAGQPTADGGYLVTTTTPGAPPTTRVGRLDATGRLGTLRILRLPGFGGGTSQFPASEPPYVSPTVPPLEQQGFRSRVLLERPRGGLLVAGSVLIQREHMARGSTGFFAATALTDDLGLDATYGGPAAHATVALAAPPQSARAAARTGVLVTGRASVPGLVLLRIRDHEGGLLAESLRPVYAAGRFCVRLAPTRLGRTVLRRGAQRVAVGAALRGVLSGTAQAQRSVRLR